MDAPSPKPAIGANPGGAASYPAQESGTPPATHRSPHLHPRKAHIEEVEKLSISTHHSSLRPIVWLRCTSLRTYVDERDNREEDGIELEQRAAERGLVHDNIRRLDLTVSLEACSLLQFGLSHPFTF